MTPETTDEKTTTGHFRAQPSRNPKYLSIYDEATDGWTLIPGSYTFMVGGSSQSLPLVEKVTLQ